MFKLGNPKLSPHLALESWVGGRSKDMLIVFFLYFCVKKKRCGFERKKWGKVCNAQFFAGF